MKRNLLPCDIYIEPNLRPHFIIDRVGRKIIHTERFDNLVSAMLALQEHLHDATSAVFVSCSLMQDMYSDHVQRLTSPFRDRTHYQSSEPEIYKEFIKQWDNGPGWYANGKFIGPNYADKYQIGDRLIYVQPVKYLSAQ